MDYSSNNIEHQGIVTEAGDAGIRIKILPEQPCEVCKVKNVCSASGGQEKFFDFFNLKDKFEAGEKVKIILKKSLAYNALFIVYLIQFIYEA